MNKGFLKGVCKGIMEALYSEETENPEDEAPSRRIPEGAKVGIVTYDKEVHFYNLSVGSRIIPCRSQAYSSRHNSTRHR